jgi:AcrR family transcriptional regulator
MPPRRVKLSREELLESIGEDWSPSDVTAAHELLVEADGQFPSHGRGVGLPAELVGAVQRERILAGMIFAVAEDGYRQVSVQDVLERAGVSRPTFYEHFDDKEDCFLAAFDAAGDRLYGRVSEAAKIGVDWRERLRSGMVELLSFVVEEPEAAQVLVIEGRAASPQSLQRRDALLDRFAGCVETTVAGEVEEPAAASGLTSAGVVGGIEALLYSRLYRGETEDLASLLPSLMYFAVLPYLGPAAAGEEMRAPAG